MNILLSAFEVSPFAKTGGLADVANSLPIEWAKAGHRVVVALPKHKEIDIEKYGFVNQNLQLIVPMGYMTEFGAVWKSTFPNSNAEVYLIEHESYYNRDGIYGNPESYHDNDRRFIFYSRAVFELAKALHFSPDIVHAHDHHSAFTMAFLKSFYKSDPLFHNTAGIYTIHNLAYQGKFEPWRVMDFSGFGMKEFYPKSWFEFQGEVNMMKVGIMFADKITTVSPQYANEIRMSYYSEGMQGVLNLRGGDLVGILNGVNYDVWNPELDDKIFENYDADSLDKKQINKLKFLNLLGFDENSNTPLVGMVTRMTEQKGLDIIKDKIDAFVGAGLIRFVMLGTGESNYTDFFQYLQMKYPGRVVVNIGYNEKFSHNIFAACDYFLMPSRFEPCGLTQMYALRYGTIPVVRATGGLVDTIQEYQPNTGTGNGFMFQNFSPDDFDFALRRALSIFDSPEHLKNIRQNGMKIDNSAKSQAEKYIDVFQWAIEKVKF